MPVKRCVIDGRSIGSLDDLYDALSRQLPFPDHFGRNLNALWDVLSAEIEGPVEVVWEESALSKEVMRKDFGRAAALLKDLEKERDDFHVEFK